ncbi:hypothetical protein [uncultured Actinomyces sp.]|uniref:hypothetical protein n=2 Tax=uncultured Actinomyces sp. TaxID=249061 RepID=UPI002889F3B8|nr:hypothetical protein [uncultured Actinomyces sp.]
MTSSIRLSPGCAEPRVRAMGEWVGNDDSPRGGAAGVLAEGDANGRAKGRGAGFSGPRPPYRQQILTGLGWRRTTRSPVGGPALARSASGAPGPRSPMDGPACRDQLAQWE